MRLPLRTRRALLIVLIPLLSSCTDVLDADDAPRVTAIEPGDLATDVARSTTITATFSKPIAPSSAATGSFRLSYQPNGYTIAQVVGTVTVRGAQVTFTPSPEPSAGLRSGMRYRVAVEGFTDLAGRSQAGSFHSMFSVIASPPPTVVSTYPAENEMDVPTSSVIVATFSEAIDPVSVTENTFDVRGGGQNGPVAGTRTVQGAEVTFTPSTTLVPGETYQVFVTPGLTDLDGASLAYQYSWLFAAGQ
jgi:hypothetical protein